jgi:hypothetical protein
MLLITWYDSIGGICSMHGSHLNFFSENLKVSEHLEELGAERKITLK